MLFGNLSTRLFVRPGLKTYKLIAVLRVRNESLIIEDTLEHLSRFCDGIVAFDDASTDNTAELLVRHPAVLALVRNKKWAPSVQDRLKAETEHRRCLMDLAARYQPEWLFCADADERYVGDIRGFVHSEQALELDGVRLSLFDAYMTPDDSAPYRRGPLLDFRRHFGVERRDILMLFRLSAAPRFEGLDRREPDLPPAARVAVRFAVQHYGKAISESQWEDTCDYYINHFPYEPYGKKWQARKGQAIHRGVSDFDTPLYSWGDELFARARCIYPQP
ncbi:hypothetical protein UN63_10035 [Oceanisphaera arctica]|uniref:Glycosyltransferase n=2 Tax=Oceanisphaera arctica TaxID=641510 RepID=A0A2P5TLH3_9GAMM|nr:hypothetical protein UN63_10035 [Oceanisphaera arctica]GHA06342.1 hypothetical protein GCM10007082_04220 [Oceanisphaera arctica]